MTKPIRPLKQDVHAVVLVPSELDWQDLRHAYEELRPGIGLGREFLSRNFGLRRVVFLHTGEDDVEAAVSAQYAVDRWSPRVLASDSDHDAYSHVAARNGLSLMRVEELELSAPAVPALPHDETEDVPAVEDAEHGEKAPEPV
jgi:hypothetical protein